MFPSLIIYLMNANLSGLQAIAIMYGLFGAKDKARKIPTYLVEILSRFCGPDGKNALVVRDSRGSSHKKNEKS